MIENDFLEEMLSKGLNPGEVVADGGWHRFVVGPNNGNKNGYYNLHPDGNGAFGNWKTGDQFYFRAGKSQQMTDQERKDYVARYKAEQKRIRQERENNHQKAAALALSIWTKSRPAPDDHWYIQKKRIKTYGTRIDDAGNLLVPIFNGHKICNLQRITKYRKLFMESGEKKGCFSFIEGQKDIIYIAEGFSTAASVAEATGRICYIALDAGNLILVAKRVRDMYDIGQRIIIAADNDQWTTIGENKVNVGIEAAIKASENIYCEYRFPRFESTDPEKRTDWNDFAAAFGIPETRAQLLPEEVLNLHVTVQQKETPKKQSIQILDYDDSGNPKCTINNLKIISENEGIIFRYNMIKKQEEILIPNESFSIDNSLNASFAGILSIAKDKGLSTTHIKEYITYLCDKNQFNPVTTWILSKPWDGVSRLQSFYETVVSEDTALKEIILTRWMISAIAAAFGETGVSAHGVLVFQGEQYLGKTSWFKRLVPQEMGVIKDGFILRLDDKDTVFQCVSHWMVELGELEATFRKSDIAQLKAFLTADRDILRRPFAPRESFYARRTVFFASVNPKEFLFDETGNRRFWAINTSGLDYNHNLDMQQVWAEFYALYLDGEPWIMSNDEIKMINKSNEDFMGANYHEELVAKGFNWSTYNVVTGDWRTSTEICDIVGLKNPKQNDLNRISKAVKQYNGNQTKRGSGGVRLLMVPNGNRLARFEDNYG